MSRIRKTHSSNFKLKVAIEAIKERKTTAELCSEFSVSASQIYLWKKQLEEHGAEIFSSKKSSDKKISNEVDKLHRIIGQITAERDFLSRVLDR